MKTIRTFFSIGVICCTFNALFLVLFYVTRIVAGEGAYNVLYFDLWLGLVQVLLWAMTKLGFGVAIVLFLNELIKGWEEGKGEITFEFEQEEKTKQTNTINLTDATSEPNYIRSSRKQPKVFGKP